MKLLAYASIFSSITDLQMDYTFVIVGTTIGFIVLAAILLVPIYNFLKKEEKASAKWTQEEIDKIRQDHNTKGEHEGEA